MRRTFKYIISFLFLISGAFTLLIAQDTLDIPLKFRAGIELSGPAIYLGDKNILSTEGYLSVDLNEKCSVFLSAGYLNYKYSQYNYEYRNNGIFARTGFDFNLMKTEKSLGKYWAGIGLHYGISHFNSVIPVFQQENYWGISSSSVPLKTSWAHFIEVSPGVKAEVFKNLSIGWNVSLRMLVYSGAGKDLRPISLPGFGNAAKKFTSGVNYFISFNIPYKKIRVIIKKEVPEEPEELESTSTYGGGQIRQ